MLGCFEPFLAIHKGVSAVFQVSEGSIGCGVTFLVMKKDVCYIFPFDIEGRKAFFTFSISADTKSASSWYPHKKAYLNAHIRVYKQFVAADIGAGRYQRQQTACTPWLCAFKWCFCCWYPSIRGLVRWISDGEKWVVAVDIGGGKKIVAVDIRMGGKTCCCWYQRQKLKN